MMRHLWRFKKERAKMKPEHEQSDKHVSDERSDLTPILLAVRDVAFLLGLGERTVWRLCGEGKLPPPISVGRSKRWTRQIIEEYVAEKIAKADSRR